MLQLMEARAQRLKSASKHALEFDCRKVCKRATAPRRNFLDGCEMKSHRPCIHRTARGVAMPTRSRTQSRRIPNGIVTALSHSSSEELLGRLRDEVTSTVYSSHCQESSDADTIT